MYNNEKTFGELFEEINAHFANMDPEKRPGRGWTHRGPVLDVFDDKFRKPYLNIFKDGLYDLTFATQGSTVYMTVYPKKGHPLCTTYGVVLFSDSEFTKGLQADFAKLSYKKDRVSGVSGTSQIVMFSEGVSIQDMKPSEFYTHISEAIYTHAHKTKLFAYASIIKDVVELTGEQKARAFLDAVNMLQMHTENVDILSEDWLENFITLGNQKGGNVYGT